MEETKKCRLCLQQKKLIKAHIIPQFMYKGMKATENAFYEITYNLDTKEKKAKKIQTGIFDKDILCGECDNGILGAIYESYAEKSMYGKELKPEIAPDCKNFKDEKSGIEYSICENIDYTKMKLFLLSILWRASISSHPVFKAVNLGEKHEERIRKILYNNEIIDELEYPIMILSFIKNDNNFNNFITQPKRIKSDNLNGYIFLMNTLQFIFYINSIQHSIPKYISEVTLKKSGKMSVIHLPKGRDLEFIKDVMKI